MPQDNRVLASIRNRRTAANKPQPTSGDTPPTPIQFLLPEPAQRPALVAGLRRLLSTEEASVYLDCHTRTVFRLVDDGRLKAYRLGRVLKFRQEDLDAVLEPVNAGPATENALDGFIDQQTTSAAP